MRGYKGTGLCLAAALAITFGPAMAQPVDDQALAESFSEEAQDASTIPCDPAVTDCDAHAEADADFAADDANMGAPEPPIDASFGKAVLGAADGDVTLVVFADYACPACREAQPVIDELIARDPKLRVVYRLLVNEEEGREAALTSLAVASSGADWSRFHHALDAGGQPTSQSIAKALASSGIDRAKLPQLGEPDSANMAIFDEVSRNGALIAQRNGQAIPAWVLGDADALNGFELEVLQAAIAAERAKARQGK